MRIRVNLFVALCLLGGILYSYMRKTPDIRNQSPVILNSEFPSPSSFTSSDYGITRNSVDDSVLPPNTFDYCGMRQPKIRFYVEPPKNWKIQKVDSSYFYQKYIISNSVDDQYLDITCGSGFGGGCEDPGIPLTINGEVIPTCSQENPDTGLVNVRVAYIDKEIFDTFGTGANTYSFTGLINKQNLDNILSTFRFTD